MGHAAGWGTDAELYWDGSGVLSGNCNQFGRMNWTEFSNLASGECHSSGRYPSPVFSEPMPFQYGDGTSHYGNCGGSGEGW